MGGTTDLKIVAAAAPADHLKTIGYMAFNSVSCISIVFCNKWLFRSYHFEYATLITCLHSLATWMGVLINHWMGQYKVKPLNHWDVFPITLSFCSYVIFNNLSLQYNSVGFFQLMKVLTTPLSVLLQDICYAVYMPWKLRLPLIPVCIGVAMATVSDVSFNLIGTFWATAGLVMTVFYQLLLKNRQDKLQVNSFQLLHYQAPQSALFVAMCTPLFDNVIGKGGFLEYNYSPSAIWAIIVSCVLAYLVNLSTFLLIGHTSPISYQVLGHLKVIVTLTTSIVFFKEDANIIRLLGMGMAFIGIVIYTMLKNRMGTACGKGSREQGRKKPKVGEEGGELVWQA